MVTLRVGMNDVPHGSETEEIVDKMVAEGYLEDSNIYCSSDNVHKYPMMRRMFHDPTNPITTPYVMWFDDDSYLKVDELADFGEWLLELRGLHQAGSTMAGARYWIGLQGNQKLWIEDQPWYTGEPIGSRIEFITGAWWSLDARVIRDFDWPVPALDHRGGDVMLGALLHQQGLQYTPFTKHVAINADADGKQCKAPRRGHDAPPVGYDYDPGATKALSDVFRRVLPYESLLD